MSRVTQARLQPNWTTYVGALQGVLAAAGLTDLDTSQLMGMAGMAFHLIMHEGCCPSSVTVYDWGQEHASGLDRIGVLSESCQAMSDWNTFSAACRRAPEHIKASIDRGTGVVLWGVDAPEFGVVYGYDDGDGAFLVDGVRSPSAPIPYENVGRSSDVPILHYVIPIERVEYDKGKSYKQSLQFYVRHMEWQAGSCPEGYEESPYKNGLRAYDNWVRALEIGPYNPFGLRYNTSVYAQAKGHAARYLTWLAQSWDGLPYLAEIAATMGENARLFDQMLAALEATGDASHLGHPVRPAQAAAVASLVRQAKGIEERTLTLVKRALASDKPQAG